MSILSDATAIRRDLIDHIKVTLQGYADVLSDVTQSDEDAIVEEIADALIDSEWVHGAPGKDSGDLFGPVLSR